MNFCRNCQSCKGYVIKNLILLIILAGIISVFLLQISWAEEETKGIIKLQEIVISATRTDKKLVETPASITIITGEEIEEMGAKNIVEVIENIPGVVKDSDSRNRVTFRGNRSVQAPGALLLVDGVPANTGISSYVEYDAIPLGDIERVEVLRSSGNMAFGPDASRGVINIITKRGKEGPPQIKLSASYGSWDTWEESASITGRIEDWDYAIGGSRLDTDGYEDETKERSAARFGVGYNFSTDTRLGFNLAWRDLKYDTSEKKTKWQIKNYRKDSVFPTSETNSDLIHYREDDNENIATSLDFTHKGNDFFINGFISYDDTDHTYDYLKYILDPDYSKTSSYYCYREDRDENRFLVRASGGYHFRFAEIAYTPTFGADYEKIEFDQKKKYPWSPVPHSASQTTAMDKGDLNSERDRWGIFLSNELDFSEYWELNLSGRVDDVEYDVKNKEPKHITKDTTDYSWNVTPAFHPTIDSTVYASVSRSYWYPVLIYYKYAMEKDSPLCKAEDLEAEEYFTYELGYKHYFGSKLSLAITGYFMKVKDKYLSIYDDSESWQGYKNIGESENKGIELEATGHLCPYFGYRFSGAYQHAEWDDATFKPYAWYSNPADDNRELVDISGKKVPHVPEFTSTLGLDFYFLEYFKFSTDINYYGEAYIDVLNRYEMDDYITVDAMLSYKRKNYKIWVLGNNIFDREEENIFNENGQRNNDGTPKHYAYYPKDGRYLEVGITFNF